MNIIEELEAPVPGMVENGRATIDFGLNYRQRKEAAALLRDCGEAFGGVRWKSADKDNMEFAARITYSQMDRIRATLAKLQPGSKGSE